MKSLQFIFLAVVAFAFVSVKDAFGMAGDLSAPSLAFPENSPLRAPVMAVLSDKGYHFLHGRFINSSSVLEYGGNAAELNKFVAKLKACGPVTVLVIFAKQEGDVAWTLHHIRGELRTILPSK